MDLTPMLAFITSSWPALAPYLAAVPLIQAACGALANLPRLWGVTHPTIWSRIMTTIATLHVYPSNATFGATSIAALGKNSAVAPVTPFVGGK